MADLGKEKKILDPTICFAGQECLKKLNNLQKAIWAWCFWMLFFSWCLQETRWLWADDRSHPCRASPILGCTWVPTNYQRYWQLKVRNLYADLLTLSIWTKFKDALVILIDHAILYVNNTRTKDMVCIISTRLQMPNNNAIIYNILSLACKGNQANIFSPKFSPNTILG